MGNVNLVTGGSILLGKRLSYKFCISFCKQTHASCKVICARFVSEIGHNCLIFIGYKYSKNVGSAYYCLSKSFGLISQPCTLELVQRHRYTGWCFRWPRPWAPGPWWGRWTTARYIWWRGSASLSLACHRLGEPAAEAASGYEISPPLLHWKDGQITKGFYQIKISRTHVSLSPSLSPFPHHTHNHPWFLSTSK